MPCTKEVWPHDTSSTILISRLHELCAIMLKINHWHMQCLWVGKSYCALYHTHQLPEIPIGIAIYTSLSTLPYLANQQTPSWLNLTAESAPCLYAKSITEIALVLHLSALSYALCFTTCVLSVTTHALCVAYCERLLVCFLSVWCYFPVGCSVSYITGNRNDMPVQKIGIEVYMHPSLLHDFCVHSHLLVEAW